jgi:conserved oligomeric Golgi complex subunit 3
MRAEQLADAKRVRIHFYLKFPVLPFFSHISTPYLQGIDQDLKHACESVISAASEPLCTPLRAFTGRPASAAEAAVLDEAFRNACASDLRASIARVRLYVPDVRTAGVLVQHALDRVEDAYSAFSFAARQVGARTGKGQDCLMDDGLLKQLLQDVRGDGAGSPPART